MHSSIAELRNEIASLHSGKSVILQPTSIALGPADTYERLDHNWKSNAETSERSVVPCSDGGPLRPLVILTLGQSNAANEGRGLHIPKYRVDNFNLYDGKCYKAVEPLLGPSGQGGNFATRLADMLIERQLANRVVLAPIAMGGTTVEQWAHEGLFNRRIAASIRRLYDAGLSADYILWHQGEGNASAYTGDAGGRQYRKNLLEVVASFRAYSVNAPFFVALATQCGQVAAPQRPQSQGRAAHGGYWPTRHFCRARYRSDRCRAPLRRLPHERERADDACGGVGRYSSRLHQTRRRGGAGALSAL